MCKSKFITFLVLAVLATSEAVTIEPSEECLKQDVAKEKGNAVTKCFQDVLVSKVYNMSDVKCQNFSDFNETFRNFHKQSLATCFNVSKSYLSKNQGTALNMIQFVMESNKTKEFIEENKMSCFSNIANELMRCNKTSHLNVLADDDTATRWFRTAAVGFNPYACAKMNYSAPHSIYPCTINIVNNTCGSDMADYTRSLFEIAFKPCIQSSASIITCSSPFSYLFFIITALTVMYSNN